MKIKSLKFKSVNSTNDIALTLIKRNKFKPTLISADQQMQFVYHLHWDHHGRPDLKGDTVSPLFKNLILACMFYLVFYMAQSPNPMLSMSALMAMYAFYEYTHWLSHADVATRTFASRMP